MKTKATYNIGGITLALIIFEVLFWVACLGAYFVLQNYAPGLVYHRPGYVWLFILLPISSISFIATLYLSNRRILSLGEPGLLQSMLPDTSSARIFFKFILFRLALFCFVVGIIGPKIGSRIEEVKTTGVDLIVALDVSNSMLAEDIAPNRLERARQSILRMIDRLSGDRIGLIVFAGDAFVQLPITSDYEAARMFINTVDSESVPIQGTAIGAAIELALESFGSSDGRSRSIIVITDGENHEDNAVKAAEKAFSQGVVVHAVGMGTPGGAPIPVYDASGNMKGFKQNAEGQTVVSALNEDMLVELVNAGGGIFTLASSTFTGLNDILAELGRMEKSEQGNYTFADYEHQFQWFFAFGFLLLILDSITGLSRKKWSSQLNFFDK
jgi:Ca-activated chloride channel family protein